MPLVKQDTKRSNWITDLFFLTALIGIFYFLWLGSYPYFTPDEGRYSEVAREMLATGDFITPRVNGVAFLDKPVLYYWLQATAMKMFGVNEWAVRFFPAVFGIFGCLVVYLSGHKLFNRRTGILSAIILAASPLYFGGSHYANLDLEVAVLVSTSLLAFLAATESQGKLRGTLFTTAYIFASLAFLTKGLIAIAFPVMITGLWILMLQRWKLLANMRLGTGVILFAVITTPWFYLVQKANPEFLHFFFVTQQVTRFLSQAEFNNKSPFWFYVPVVLAGFMPWSGFAFQSIIKHIKTCWRARTEHAPQLYLLLWLIVVFTFFSIPRSKTVSYILPVFPPLALLTGKYLADYWQIKTRRTGISMGVFFVIGLNVVIGSALFVLPKYWVDVPLDFIPVLFLAGCELLISALLLTLMMGRLRTPAIFFICAVTSITMLLTFSGGARYLNQNSAKPVIETLKPLLKQDDVVANYFKFYQDVPLYLERTIVLVADWDASDIEERDNWIRELWYSKPFQKTDDILLNEPAFWKLWHSGKHVYVFVNANYFSQFKEHTRRYHFITQHNDIILLENRPR